MSRYDQPDPSLDPSYCDGLSADDDGPMPTCFWCGEPFDSDTDFYCSALCANYALIDSEDR
jgi:hypothetical protein